jgi:hypothetical protein
MTDNYPYPGKSGSLRRTCLHAGRLLVGAALLFACTHTYGQINLSGKPGMIYTPSAVETDNGMFRFGYNYNPMRYALRGRDKNAERILYASVSLFSRLEININFLQMISSSRRKVKEGLGDRQLDLRYLLLKEKKKRPSLAIILTTPFTIDGAMLTHALVATKNFALTNNLKLEASIGYGSPYYLYRNASTLKDDGMFSDFKWQKKSEDKYHNHYLQGPFGGAVLHYRSYGGLMAEYDSKHINVGVYGKLFKNWTLQAGLINGDKFTFGTSYAIALAKPSKRLIQQNDENKR